MERNKRHHEYKEIEHLPDNWKEIILETAKFGGSEVEMRFALFEESGRRIHTQWWTEMKKRNKEFKEVLDEARDLCRAWWERFSRTELYNKDFNNTMWIFNMKNRFGWADRKDISQTIASKEPVKIQIINPYNPQEDAD